MENEKSFKFKLMLDELKKDSSKNLESLNEYNRVVNIYNENLPIVEFISNVFAGNFGDDKKIAEVAEFLDDCLMKITDKKTSSDESKNYKKYLNAFCDACNSINEGNKPKFTDVLDKNVVFNYIYRSSKHPTAAKFYRLMSKVKINIPNRINFKLNNISEHKLSYFSKISVPTIFFGSALLTVSPWFIVPTAAILGRTVVMTYLSGRKDIRLNTRFNDKINESEMSGVVDIEKKSILKKLCSCKFKIGKKRCNLDVIPNLDVNNIVSETKNTNNKSVNDKEKNKNAKLISDDLNSENYRTLNNTLSDLNAVKTNSDKKENAEIIDKNIVSDEKEDKVNKVDSKEESKKDDTDLNKNITSLSISADYVAKVMDIAVAINQALDNYNGKPEDFDLKKGANVITKFEMLTEDEQKEFLKDMNNPFVAKYKTVLDNYKKAKEIEYQSNIIIIKEAFDAYDKNMGNDSLCESIVDLVEKLGDTNKRRAFTNELKDYARKYGHIKNRFIERKDYNDSKKNIKDSNYSLTEVVVKLMNFYNANTRLKEKLYDDLESSINKLSTHELEVLIEKCTTQYEAFEAYTVNNSIKK